MNNELPKSGSPFVPLLALLGALVMSAGLFLLVPLTQSLNAEPGETIKYRRMAISLPPPPKIPPPPEPSQREEPAEEPESPKLEREMVDVPLTRLEYTLNAGMGVPLSMEAPAMPAIAAVNTVAEIEKIFNFDELSNPPQAINARQIRIDYPRYLSRRGVRSVKVVLEILIDRSGRTKVKRLISTSYENPLVEPMARRVAEQIRFTITRVDGKAVNVVGHFPLDLRAP